MKQLSNQGRKQLVDTIETLLDGISLGNVANLEPNKLDESALKYIAKERIEKKYGPLRSELAAVEADIEKYSRPSSNLDKDKIEKIIAFMKRLPDLYEVFTKKERKQFLKWFTTQIWIRDKKIVDIAYKPGFQALIDRDLVRISETWLPVWDFIRTVV